MYIVCIDSLLLCGAITIMKFELRSEESRTILISLASVCVWPSTLALDVIEMFLCLLAVLFRIIASFRPYILMQRSNPSFHSLDFMLVPKRLGFILAHPPDASQERHALRTVQTNCPSPIHEDLSMQQCSTPMIFGLLPPRKTYVFSSSVRRPLCYSAFFC